MGTSNRIGLWLMLILLDLRLDHLGAKLMWWQRGFWYLALALIVVSPWNLKESK
jgi:hypothetical protein